MSRSGALILVPVILLALAGCAPSGEDAPSRPAPTPPAAEVDVVPGYDVGQFPPVPLFTIPDLSLVDATQSKMALSLSEHIGATLPGVMIENAHCDASGVVIPGDGSAGLYGDSSIVTDGTGAGILSGPDATLVDNGDGSGTFSGGDVTIVSNGDGSGTYSSSAGEIVIGGDGSGTHSGGAESIVNNGDGSGTYTAGTIQIVNNGDGSGTYADGTIQIVNNGDGTALVNGTETDADPLPPVPQLGSFPSFDALEPAKTCGTRIKLSSDILFDFGRAELREEAVESLSSLAGALIGLDVPALTITGHTDSIGDPEDNQALSEERAKAVADELETLGVAASITAAGHGEEEPVAPNEIDGHDNPAGRQLNRRVDIVVPAG